MDKNKRPYLSCICRIRVFFGSEKNVAMYLWHADRIPKILNNNKYAVSIIHNERFPIKTYCIFCGNGIEAKLDVKNRAFIRCFCGATAFFYDRKAFDVYLDFYADKVIQNPQKFMTMRSGLEWH
ncbi:MAG: hypothetical protein HY606_00335 [Planctomycetes bacterium]|nr:hypothetical protein [Planctomycetota bacterium]